MPQRGSEDAGAQRWEVAEAGSGVAEMATILAVGLNGKPYFIHWGWFQISAANLALIVAMVVVFVAAILLPFPRRGR